MLYGGIGAAALIVIALIGWFVLGGSDPAQDTQKQGTQVADATLKPANPPGTPGSGTGPGSTTRALSRQPAHLTAPAAPRRRHAGHCQSAVVTDSPATPPTDRSVEHGEA